MVRDTEPGIAGGGRGVFRPRGPSHKGQGGEALMFGKGEKEKKSTGTMEGAKRVFYLFAFKIS